LEIFLLSNGFSGAHDFHSNNSNVFYKISELDLFNNFKTNVTF
jgi:hypothetical protein